MPRRKRRKSKKHNNKSKPAPKAESPTPNIDLDKIFCLAAKESGLEKLLLKAVATVESALDIRAYRYEQGFWDMYLKDNADWKDKEPRVVSASYGLMQIMYVVAHEAGFTGTDEDLYNPVMNIKLGAKILKARIDKSIGYHLHTKHQIWPIRIGLAQYNGGRGGNPRDTGELRNQSYVDKVFKVWHKLRQTEEECDD